MNPLQELYDLGACHSAVEWIGNRCNGDCELAWQVCTSPPWMLWILGRRQMCVQLVAELVSPFITPHFTDTDRNIFNAIVEERPISDMEMMVCVDQEDFPKYAAHGILMDLVYAVRDAKSDHLHYAMHDLDVHFDVSNKDLCDKIREKFPTYPLSTTE